MSSAKRKHGRPSSTSSERRPANRQEEEKQEPEPKRTRKDPAPSFAPPTRENGGSLGGLPLYGEKLPVDGYSTIPVAAKKACQELRQVMMSVKELKTKSNGKSVNEELYSQRKAGTLLFAQLRRLNRLSNLYCKETRDRTMEKKQSVDELHLQLQNLQYEAKHLQKEITSCLEFKSKHEELQLISEEEFYEVAPDTLTKPEITRRDPHKLMLARLEWELKQREQLSSRQSSLETAIKSKQNQTQALEEKLSGLQPSLEQLRVATVPLQEFFGITLDWEREQYHLAILLPRPLYLMYVQAEGYSKVEDTMLKVSVNGDIDEAKSFMFAKEQYIKSGQEENELSDQEGESNSKKKKRRKSKIHNEDEPLFRKSFPLSVSLTIATPGIGSVTVTFHFLPFFNAICSSVTSIDLETDSVKSLFIDRTSFLHNLFEGDSGKTSPNSAVSLQIRKYGGDNFSSVVRQYGFPYKWVQQVCGINLPSDNCVDINEIKLDVELGVASLMGVVSSIRDRMKAQYQLTEQLTSLEQLKLSTISEEGVVGPSSQLTRWKQLTLSEVQASQFDNVSLFNLQERSNRYFMATFQLGQAQWHTIVSVTPSYPHTLPVFIILVELNEKQKETFNIQLKNIEADVNIQYPLTLSTDKYGKMLLYKQLLRLQLLVDSYIHSKTGSTSLNPRGKGRLLTSSLV